MVVAGRRWFTAERTDVRREKESASYLLSKGERSSVILNLRLSCAEHTRSINAGVHVRTYVYLNTLRGNSLHAAI